MRVVYCALVGAACALLAVAGAGAVDGYRNGAGANLQHPPGLRSSALGALTGAVVFGPIAIGCGALVGGCVGLVGRVVTKGRGPRRPGPAA